MHFPYNHDSTKYYFAGICYGFQVMEDVESPNIPFTILRTRFHTGKKENWSIQSNFAGSNLPGPLKEVLGIGTSN